MAEGDDTSLDDIKLSDFDLDFDVWKTVIDETQEEHMSSLEKKQDQNISYSSSDITQAQFSGQGFANGQLIKVERSEMDVPSKKEGMLTTEVHL